MSNRVNLTLDVTKKGVQNPLIKIRQGDGDFETLRTTVLSNGEPLDLQGWTITFMATTAGNHKIVDSDTTVVEAQNGIFEYTPSKAWGMDVGDFKIAYFKFVKDDGSASSANLRVEVITAVDLTQDEAQNYISVIDATIVEAREHLESSLADVSSSVAATSVAASSMAVNVSNVASSAADNVNGVASNAIENVNIVASSAVNNVNVNASNAIDKVDAATSSYANEIDGVATNAVDKIGSAASGASLATSRAIDEVNSVASNAVNNVSNVASSAVAKVNGVAAQVNSLSIGGRNLLLGTQSLTGSQWTLNGVLNGLYKNAAVLETATSGAIFAYNKSELVLSNKINTSDKFIISMYINNSSGSDVTITIASGSVNEGNKIIATVSSGSGWKRISGQMSFWTLAGNPLIGLNIQGVGTQGKVLSSMPKLELGNITTDWTPAPEDAPSNDAQLVHKTNNETLAGDKTLVGNTNLATTTILAGSYGLRVTASGIQKTTDGKTWVSANI